MDGAVDSGTAPALSGPMRSSKIHSFGVALSVIGVGCAAEMTVTEPAPKPSSTCEDPGVAGCVVASDKQRIINPSVPDADLEALVDGNTAFALDLHQHLRATPGNLFYSPYSVSSALSMTYAALRFTLPGARLHPAFNALDQALASRGDGAGGQGNGLRLNVANALWGQVGTSFAAPFLDVLSESYGAGLRVVDFVKAPSAAREIINGWVAERTEDRIKDLLPEGSVGPRTRLLLTNAIYFNAAWETPFKTESTAPADFTLLDGTTVSVPMMNGTVKLGYGEGEGYAALDMPYLGRELSMVLILPTALAAFEPTFDAARLTAVLASLGPRNVTVSLPRFRVESSLDLVPPLSAMGMPIAFSEAADFTGISAQGGFAVSGVMHKAFVNVDEAGTEAAAATGVVVGTTSLPAPATIRFDRPFLFFLRDTETGTVLFVGRVTNPA
jgi:serpin B